MLLVFAWLLVAESFAEAMVSVQGTRFCARLVVYLSLGHHILAATRDEPKSKMLCAFRCVASQGFLRTTRHIKLKNVLTATRDASHNEAPLADIAWEVQDSGFPGGWVWLRHYHSREYARAIVPPEKPAGPDPDVEETTFVCDFTRSVTRSSPEIPGCSESA